MGDMRLAFTYFDTDHDGFLEYDELYDSFQAACPFVVSAETFRSIWYKMDTNHDNRVTIDECVEHLVFRAGESEHGIESLGRREVQSPTNLGPAFGQTFG